MLANGHLTAQHLFLYLTMQEIKANQHRHLTSDAGDKSKTTAYERVFGQRPLTVLDLIQPSAFPEVLEPPPWMQDIPLENIILTGSLTKGGALTEDFKEAMRGHNIAHIDY